MTEFELLRADEGFCASLDDGRVQPSGDGNPSHGACRAQLHDFSHLASWSHADAARRSCQPRRS